MNEWLSQVRSWDLEGLHRKAVQRLFDEIDEMCEHGAFADIDVLLSELDLSDMSTSLIIGLLSVTLPAKDLLPTRVGILSQARKTLSEREPERVDRLLKGLT